MEEITVHKLFEQISTHLAHDPDHTLESMLSYLETCRPTNYESFVNFDESRYQRILMYRDSNVDAYLLTWLPGQETRYHKHPSKGCIYRVLQGTLKEYRKTDDCVSDIDATESTLNTGTCAHMDDTLGIHKVKNESVDMPAISIHFYAPSGYYDGALTSTPSTESTA